MSYSSTKVPISLTFNLKKCLGNYSYSISVIIQDLSSGFQENFQTEEITCKENNSEITFTKKMSCNYYFEKNYKLLFKISKRILIDSNYKVKVYERITVLSSLVNSPNSKYERKVDENNIDSEIISIQLDKNNGDLENKTNTLFDYFKSGVKFSCFISSDFSNSEKNPSLLENKDNYKRIYKKISDIIANYTKKHLFYSYGFNAKIKNSLSDESIFNLNLNGKDSSIYTMDEVLKNFEKFLNTNSIISLKNINLSPIIKKITKDIYKLYNLRYYNVSFIIIRGNIDKNDIQKTIDAIIESSYLPLTTIVIGLGNIDYTETRKIIYSNKKLSSIGMQKLRNNVLFAALIGDFSNNVEELINWCLIELSKQIISFYNLSKSSPKDIYEYNLKNLEESFNIYSSSIAIGKSIYVPSSEIDGLNKRISRLILDNNDNNNQNLFNEGINNSQENSEASKVDKSNKKSNNNNINNSYNNSGKENSQKRYVITPNPSINVSNMAQNVYMQTSNPSINNSNMAQNVYIQTPNPSINNSNNSNMAQNVYMQTPNPSINNSNMAQNVYMQTPKPSINVEITNNPYAEKKVEEKFSTPGGPNTDSFKNRKYNLPQQSIVGKNQMDTNYNPYNEEFKSKNSGNLGESNSSFGAKKNKNISKASEFNSTKNSENIKISEYSQFNNNYSIDNSHFK